MTAAVIGAATSEPGGIMDALLRWANVSTAGEAALVGFGILAQLLFFMRWLVQWIASERRGASHIPLLFWWLSLAGATLLLVYFLLRGEPVGVLGQSVGWFIYGRNLYLIRRSAARDASVPFPED